MAESALTMKAVASNYFTYSVPSTGSISRRNSEITGSEGNYGGYSGHGYGHSGYGHGHSGGGYGHKEKCCPLVIDALCLAAILGALAGATVFLNTAITMNLGRRRRRKREVLNPPDTDNDSSKDSALTMGSSLHWQLMELFNRGMFFHSFLSLFLHQATYIFQVNAPFVPQ